MSIIVNKSRNVNNDSHQTATITDNQIILQALALINDCNKYKMDLATDGVVITDAIKSVLTNKEKLMSNKEDKNGKESKEPDYDEDNEQLEEEQEEKAGEPSEEKETTNQVF
jgi:hypothetical protein